MRGVLRDIELEKEVKKYRKKLHKYEGKIIGEKEIKRIQEILSKLGLLNELIRSLNEEKENDSGRRRN